MLSAAVNRHAEGVTLTRFAAGSYADDGRYVSGSSSSEAISATVQPVGGKGRSRIEAPEGVIAEATATAWSLSELRVDDVIERSNGERFRVIWAQNWAHIGSFYRALLKHEPPA